MLLIPSTVTFPNLEEKNQESSYSRMHKKFLTLEEENKSNLYNRVGERFLNLKEESENNLHGKMDKTFHLQLHSVYLVKTPCMQNPPDKLR